MASPVIGKTVLDPLMRITGWVLWARAELGDAKAGRRAKAARARALGGRAPRPRGERSGFSFELMEWLPFKSTLGAEGLLLR